MSYTYGWLDGIAARRDDATSAVEQYRMCGAGVTWYAAPPCYWGRFEPW